ncbi:MAG: cupin domain-containing protein [Armatimonadetes bacterium]|nr:cupin domain-containing protein [Armatimonadota bacterium]
MRTTVVHTDETARQEFDWGTIAWCVSEAAGNSEKLTLGRVVIRPGQSNPRHAHHTCDEVLYLLSGELVHYADDMEPVRMLPRDAISIPAGVFHNATCVSDAEAEMLVTYSSARRDIEHG